MAPAKIYGAYEFNVMQIGPEALATPGTPATVDVIWRGPATDITDESETSFVEEQTGLLATTGNRISSNSKAILTTPSAPVTFEHIIYVFEAGIQTVKVITVPGAGPTGTTPYVWRYPFEVTAAATAVREINTMTWETGNTLSGDGHSMYASFVPEFSLTGEIGQPWMLEATWEGWAKTVAPLTGSIALATVEEAMFQNTTFYIDEPGGTIGATEITGVMSAATINVVTGAQAVWTPNGTLHYSYVKFVKPTITVSITMELEGTAAGTVVAERAKYAAGTLRQIRLKTTGTNGKYLQFDACVNWTSVGNYENQDGDTVVTFEGEAKYGPADALLAEFSVGNLVAAL